MCTSLIVRCSREDAARIRKEASSGHRSLSGYLLYVLERTFYIEDRVPPLALARQAQLMGAHRYQNPRTAIQLCCTVEQAARIRQYAARRELSISAFVVFSLRRVWKAYDHLREGSAPKALPKHIV